MQLGKKIRDLRCRRGLTVQQLAAASGLSKGFISQVEHDRTSPSLSSLKVLAQALDTSVAYLVVDDDRVPYLVREHERPQIRLAGDVARLEVLTPQPRRNLELLMTEIPVGATTDQGANGHHGEKCIVCLEGCVTVVWGQHRLALERGDSCHSDACAPHSLENTGPTIARVLIALTPAAFEPVPPRPSLPINASASM